MGLSFGRESRSEGERRSEVRLLLGKGQRLTGHSGLRWELLRGELLRSKLLRCELLWVSWRELLGLGSWALGLRLRCKLLRLRRKW